MPEFRGMNLIVPEHDTEYRGYLLAAGEKRLVMKKCSGCGLLRFPPGAACPWCQSLESTWEQVTGKGTIYSYSVVMQAIQPGFRDWAPYTIILVELDEQRNVPNQGDALRITTNLVTDAGAAEKEENVGIGKRVEVTFFELGDGLGLPQFKLSDEPPAGSVWQFQVK